MRAVLSGRAAVAILNEGDSWHAMTYEESELLTPCHAAQAKTMLRNAHDLIWLEDVSIEEVRDRLADVVDSTEALDCVLYLLDGRLQPETRNAVALEFEELAAWPEIIEEVESVLLAKPLPTSADMVGAIAACERTDARAATQLFRYWHSLQPTVRAVHDAWLQIPVARFGDTTQQTTAQGHFINHGIFAALVRTDRRSPSLTTFQFSSSANVQLKHDAPGAVGVINDWLQLLSGWQQFVDIQKRFFVDAIRSNDSERAKRITQVSIQDQVANDGALAAFDEVVAAHPENFVAKTGRAEVLKSGESTMQNAAETVREYANKATEVLKAQRNLSESVAAFDEVIAAQPGDIMAKTRRAEVVQTHANSPEPVDGTFTVDVEDYFQVSAFASVIKPDDWDQYDCRVENSTRQILDIAAKQSTFGTFFILGWVAERFPHLVTEIRSAGHEIGCRSQWNQLVYELGPARFRADLIQSRDVLQNILGERVRLYRAPSFSITLGSLWALDILVEEGFETDSSIYPTRHDRYGIHGSPKSPYVIQTSNGPIREFPGMTGTVAGMTVPVGGGVYLRLTPWRLTARLLRQIRSAGRPLNVYLRPWEVDVDQPRIAASLKSPFRHYQNLSSTAPKLARMLSQFRLTTMTAALDQSLLAETAPAAFTPATGTARGYHFPSTNV